MVYFASRAVYSISYTRVTLRYIHRPYTTLLWTFFSGRFSSVFMTLQTSTILACVIYLYRTQTWVETERRLVPVPKQKAQRKNSHR